METRSRINEDDNVTLLFGNDEWNVSIRGIEIIATKLREEPASHIAQQYAQLKRLYDDLEGMRKRMSKQIEFLKTVVLPEAFEREGITSFTTKDGYRVTVGHRVFASCLPDMKFEAYQWLKENGFEDIVTETVNAGTLSSLAKSLLTIDDPSSSILELPEELFKVEIKPQTSSTKVSK